MEDLMTSGWLTVCCCSVITGLGTCSLNLIWPQKEKFAFILVAQLALSCNIYVHVLLHNAVRFTVQNYLRQKVSKETVVLYRWEYYKILWFYQLG